MPRYRLVLEYDYAAFVLERGEADDDEIEEALADALPASGNAPD